MDKASSDYKISNRPISFAESTQAPCPQCGQPVNLDIWLIVDTAERPDLAERVRDGTLHEAPCPHCGHAGQVDPPGSELNEEEHIQGL